MHLDRFCISIESSVREVLSAIEANHLGIVFFSNSDKVIVGVATDGDVRRHLLNGGKMDDRADLFAKRDFVWELPNTPREVLLKKLDHGVHAIPLLDEAGRIVEVVSSSSLPLQHEGPIYARARAPVRVSFSGGGSDLTHYFAKSKSGAVINTTISLYSHAILKKRNDGKIIVHSTDLDESLELDSLSEVRIKGRFSLIMALLKAIHPVFGFELYLNSDYPMNSGLGGSSAVAASVIGCFNQFRSDQWNLYEIAEICYQAERHLLNIAGGWQDQYSTVFGGFNFMEFRMDQNIIHPLRIPTDTLMELEESLILCDSGIAHKSGEIHDDQRQQMKKNNISELVQKNVELSYEMRDHLLRGRLKDFAMKMDKAWQNKRQFSKKISSSYLDDIYSNAKSNGAIAGKLLGAGGGGFFLFFVPASKKHNMYSYLKEANFNIRSFRFESNGLQSWSVRDDKI